MPPPCDWDFSFSNKGDLKTLWISASMTCEKDQECWKSPSCYQLFSAEPLIARTLIYPSHGMMMGYNGLT